MVSEWECVKNNDVNQRMDVDMGQHMRVDKSLLVVSTDVSV